MKKLIRAAYLSTELLDAADHLGHITSLVKVDSLKQTCFRYTVVLAECTKRLYVLHLKRKVHFLG